MYDCIWLFGIKNLSSRLKYLTSLGCQGLYFSVSALSVGALSKHVNKNTFLPFLEI